jgi:acetyl esterase
MSAPIHSPELHLSAENWARLRAVNACWNDDIVKNRAAVLEIYSPLARQADKQGITVTRDIRYGADARQCLDVFALGAGGQRPVFVFVHGGAFTRGGKSVDGEIYDNVLYWAARNGFVGVNIEYRLAPRRFRPARRMSPRRSRGWRRISASMAATAAPSC